MKKGKKYIGPDGIEYFMCPFTDMLITQGSGMNGNTYSHNGTMANDVRGKVGSTKYPFYAPCKVKCVRIYAPNGEATWQSVNKVRFANGRVDYATFETCHDETFNAYVGMVVDQGVQLGNMGAKGGATGIHTHIQISQSKDSTFKKNKYGILTFNNEYDTDDCYFVDDTNIIEGFGGSWKYIKDVPVEEFKPYMAIVTCDVLNVRSGPGTNYKVNTVTRKNDVHTIVKKEANWGEIKSGGWICLDYTKLYSEDTKTRFGVGDIVVPTKLVDVNGRRLYQYDKEYTITAIEGNNATLSALRNKKYVVWATLPFENIKLA